MNTQMMYLILLLSMSALLGEAHEEEHDKTRTRTKSFTFTALISPFFSTMYYRNRSICSRLFLLTVLIGYIPQLHHTTRSKQTDGAILE